MYLDYAELQAKNKKITIISDYGHHPNEILATISAVREKYKKKIGARSGS